MRRRGFAVLLALAMLLAALPGWSLAAETDSGDQGDAVISVRANYNDEAEVSAASLEEAVENALSGSAAVRIQVSLYSDPGRLMLELPVKPLGTLGARKGATLTVSSALGDVTMDHDALAAIARQASGETAIMSMMPIPITKLNDWQWDSVGNCPVYDLSMVSGSGTISAFGGGIITVTLPYELPAKQKPAGVVVWSMDNLGGLTACETRYDTEAEKVTFETRHFSLYAIGYEEPLPLPFTDVPGGYWAYSEINWAYGKGLMSGKTDTLFQPDGTVTRQQVWMTLARLSGADPANMAEAKAWALKSGISDGSDPGSAVTRQQLVTLLYRYAELMGYPVSGKASLANFPDAGTISPYAKDAMAWAVGNFVISGSTGGYLNPGSTATRAQFATILWRFWSMAV